MGALSCVCSSQVSDSLELTEEDIQCQDKTTVHMLIHKYTHTYVHTIYNGECANIGCSV